MTEAPPGAAVGRAAARCLQALMVQQATDSGDCARLSGYRLARELDDQACRELSGNPPIATERHEIDKDLCRFLARILTWRGPDVHGYLHDIVAEGPQELVADRHDCGCQLVRARLTPTWLAAGQRWLYACERCGTVANQPVTLRLPRWSTQRRGRADVDLPFVSGDGWYASSVQPVACQPDQPRRVHARTAPHWPHLSLLVPGYTGDGLRRWGVAAVSDGDYLVLQRPLAATMEDI